MKNNYYGGLWIIFLSCLWLQGCSWLNIFEETEGHSERELPIRFEDRWYHSGLPAKSLGLPEESKTLVGKCEFQPELLKRLSDQSRGLLFPLMSFNHQGQVFLDPLASMPLYKALQPQWSLGSPYDSLQLYHRWVSSIEHSGPEGLRRELSHCAMKPLYSLGGLLGDDSNYDLKRLNNWLAKQEPLDFLILPNLELLKSDAVLKLSYSPNSPMITKQPADASYHQIQPFMMEQTLDWILLDKGSQLISDDFISVGHCSVTWPEPEERIDPGEEAIGFEQLAQVNGDMNQYMIQLLSQPLFNTDY
ncbi:hypothetical protein [Endozoicomonas sp.]|uniref:hypothetical protein n=1 Tax=Endozoicomonas sp. TaxID=1892382 RepID=UPI003AF589FC